MYGIVYLFCSQDIEMKVADWRLTQAASGQGDAEDMGDGAQGANDWDGDQKYVA